MKSRWVYALKCTELVNWEPSCWMTLISSKQTLLWLEPEIGMGTTLFSSSFSIISSRSYMYYFYTLRVTGLISFSSDRSYFLCWISYLSVLAKCKMTHHFQLSYILFSFWHDMVQFLQVTRMRHDNASQSFSGNICLSQ